MCVFVVIWCVVSFIIDLLLRCCLYVVFILMLLLKFSFFCQFVVVFFINQNNASVSHNSSLSIVIIHCH